VTILFDTQLLLWSLREPERLSAEVRDTMELSAETLHFSVASVWEVAIKTGMGKPSFAYDAGLFRRRLIENGFAELEITGAHAAAVQALVRLHGDPFDRLLIAQAITEGLMLFTNDRQLVRYPGPIRLV
jgi:PIN domain nuclease of toxin-antitoxin system